jgi:hypothetical protein
MYALAKPAFTSRKILILHAPVEDVVEKILKTLPDFHSI